MSRRNRPRDQRLARDVWRDEHWRFVARGEDSGAAKLTDVKVAEMIGRYHRQQPRCTIRGLSIEYGVAYATAWRVLRGDGWKHVRVA